MTRGPNLGGMPKTAIVRRMWREHQENMNRMRSLVFEMMSHPDTTDEHIAHIRQTCIRTAERNEELRKLMIKKGFEV